MRHMIGRGPRRRASWTVLDMAVKQSLGLMLRYPMVMTDFPRMREPPKRHLASSNTIAGSLGWYTGPVKIMMQTPMQTLSTTSHYDAHCVTDILKLFCPP